MYVWARGPRERAPAALNLLPPPPIPGRLSSRIAMQAAHAYTAAERILAPLALLAAAFAAMG